MLEMIRRSAGMDRHSSRASNSPRNVHFPPINGDKADMSLSLKYVLAGSIAGIAVGTFVAASYLSWSGGKTGGGIVAGFPAQDLAGLADIPASGSLRNEKAPMEELVKDSVPASAVDRVKSRVMRGEFQLTGHGEDAKWGVTKTATFLCTGIVIADSEIVSKEALPDGKIRITEIRTFKTVQDSIVVSDVDIKLAMFDTLPLKSFSSMVDAAAIVWASMTGDAGSSAAVLTGKNYVENKLRDIDGTGIKSLLGATGLEAPEAVRNTFDKIAGAAFRKALGGIRPISGKSYKITYYQEASGKPLYVKITYSNGEEVTDEEEQMVLKRVNAFIDYDVLPDLDCEPGDTWTVETRNIQELFDPFAEGSCSGAIAVERRVNTPDGDWDLQLKPSVINVINAGNNTTGYYNLHRGYARINPEEATVSELFGTGTARMQKISKRHWLFTARINGECEFQGKLVSSRKE